MSKFFNPSVRTMQKKLHARAICVREILLTYACIFLIESACLFPAVWVR
jgi:hypothetical protein